MAGAGDRIQTQLVGLAFGVLAVGNDADALAFDVVQLGITAFEVEGDVVHPADGAVLQQGIVLSDRAHKRIFGFVEVDRHLRVGCGGLAGSRCSHRSWC